MSQSIVYLPLTMFRHFGFTMLNKRKEASRGILRDCEISEQLHHTTFLSENGGSSLKSEMEVLHFLEFGN